MASAGDTFLRGLCLFVLGVLFFWTCEALQGIRSGVKDPHASLFDFVDTSVWVPLSCGFLSVIVGLLSPCIDFRLGRSDVYENEWPSVLKCVAVFLGLTHATARIDFASHIQLVLIIIGLSLALWWTFDRSSVGLGCGMAAAVIAVILGHSFLRKRMIKLSHPAMAAWVPCLFFSGGVTMVLVGRQLAKPDVLARFKKKLE